MRFSLPRSIGLIDKIFALIENNPRFHEGFGLCNTEVNLFFELPYIVSKSMAKKPKNVARKHRHWQRWLKLTLVAVFGFIIFNLATNLAICWSINQQKPVEAILVLGGSIRREIYVANLAQQYPDIPILISQGSEDPCILLLFERAKAPKHLQSHGIAVEIDAVREIGIPGNNESKLKTGLDVTRSIIWAFVGQLISPPCWQVIPLNSVDLEAWRDEGFKCEYQGKIS